MTPFGPELTEYVIEFHEAGKRSFKLLGTYDSAGRALSAYGQVALELGEVKRLKRNGKVIARDAGPCERIHPCKPAEQPYEYGVLTSVARDNDDVIPAADEDDAIDIAQRIKHAPGDITASPVRRRLNEQEWRDYQGYSVTSLIGGRQ